MAKTPKKKSAAAKKASPAKKSAPAKKAASLTKPTFTLSQVVLMLESVGQKTSFTSAVAAPAVVVPPRQYTVTPKGPRVLTGLPTPSEARTVLTHMIGHPIPHSDIDLEAELHDPLFMIGLALTLLERLGAIA